MREHVVIGLFPVLFLAILVSATVANDDIAREKFNDYVNQITSSDPVNAGSSVQSADSTISGGISPALATSERAADLRMAGYGLGNCEADGNSTNGEQVRDRVRLMSMDNTCTGDQQRDRNRQQNRDRSFDCTGNDIRNGDGFGNRNGNGNGYGSGNSGGNGYGNRQRNENAFRGGSNNDVAPGFCDGFGNGNRYNNYGQNNSGNQYGNGNSGNFGGFQNRQQNRYGQGNSGGQGNQGESGGSHNGNGGHHGGGNGNGNRR